MRKDKDRDCCRVARGPGGKEGEVRGQFRQWWRAAAAVAGAAVSAAAAGVEVALAGMQLPRPVFSTGPHFLVYLQCTGK